MASEPVFFNHNNSSSGEDKKPTCYSYASQRDRAGHLTTVNSTRRGAVLTKPQAVGWFVHNIVA